ncbi:MAG: hypothetical protein COC19_03885 [SAR86 cluster bacterium]|uniref:Tellurite resistance methyltransferase TehB-like domain-containing protein n=1 Tax=SAR86 cluster bacterium TaxID=2030880 RepID=A0A2A4MNQ8_9GAMM|nr:MAG: hypothetical protein COC19_03885 [SAR86 cluster bacterium]
MSCNTSNVSDLVRDQIDKIRQISTDKGVLDLACGRGRNGLYLLRQDIPVTFVDVDTQALTSIRSALNNKLDISRGNSEDLAAQRPAAQFCQLDLEAGFLTDGVAAKPLGGRVFDTVLVFNYLHRPIMPWLKETVKPGGLILYETFTYAQAAIGRPSNRGFLLAPGELRELFDNWQILYYFEGEFTSPKRAKACLVARKPQ